MPSSFSSIRCMMTPGHSTEVQTEGCAYKRTRGVQRPGVHLRSGIGKRLTVALGVIAGAHWSCKADEGDLVEVVREVNGAFSPDGERMLVARSRYRTSDPSAPYFSDGQSRDWTAILLEGDVEVSTWAEERESALEYVPMFWRPDENRLFYVFSGEPSIAWLVDTTTGQHTELKLPASLEEELLRDARFPIGRTQPIPSPDGTTVALYSVGTPTSGFKIALSFFSVTTGAHLSSRVVPWPSPVINPWLVSPDGYQHPFLWAKDSSGVYVLDCEYAAFVPVEEAQPIADVEQVPSHAVPTKGGPVRDDGSRFVVVNETSGDEMTVAVKPWGEWPVYGAEPPTQWIPFDDVPLVPLSEVKYCQPR